MQRISLQPDDDIISIMDRMAWCGHKQMLLVLPQDGGVLREGLDLVRLRRYADRERFEVGLVTADVELTRQAKAVGIPTFDTVRQAQTSRRGWWRGRKRSEVLGLPPMGRRLPSRLRQSTADRAEAARRISPSSLRRRWLVRYTAVLLFCITLSLLYVMFTYMVPGATLILQPEVTPLRVEQQIVADPTLAEIDYGRQQLPGRLLSVTTSWQAAVDTTGSIDVPDASARGTVLFVNQLAQEVVVPAGTRVSTSDGTSIIFQTVDEAVLAAVTGSTAEVAVIAVEPGAQGNVAANRINQVSGALAAQVEVRNLDDLTGGGNRLVAAVAEEDMRRLRAQVLQFLQALALSEMEADLSPREFLTRDSLRVVTIFSETYSHSQGEQTPRLTLEIRAELNGTAVNSTEASGLAYERLIGSVPEGYTLVPDSIAFESGDVVATDDAGRVTFIMIATAVAAVDLPVSAYLDVIRGQDADAAMAYLQQQLPLRATPQIEVWPVWFDRVPYSIARIETRVETGQ